jgi:predicted RecA/RadA family phage recombinase
VSVINIPGIIRGGQTEKYADSKRWTATVGAGQAATGGLLVESMAGDRVVRTVQSGSMVCVGLAIHDAAAAATVTVASEGVWMLTADGTIGAGNKVIPATGTVGRVIVAGVAPDARSLVGRVISDVTAGNLVPTILTV